MRAQPKASHFVNGSYFEDDAGDAIDCIYAADGTVVARLYEATDAVTEAAISAAKAAGPAWAAMTGTERGRILRRASDMMRDLNQSLSETETLDTGKPLQETLVADATSGADALEYFGGLAGSITGEHIPLPGGDWAYTIREPLGVCVGIGAWNYPTQIACWKAAPALACGNTMVFKPSETTPLSALRVAEILKDAGLPDGVFNVVQGRGGVGAALIGDNRVAKVSLTGSVPTGKKVYAAAAAGMRHVTMELGGKSPLLVFADADLDKAVSGAILGNFYSSGQVCSNGTRVFVENNVRDDFVARLVRRLRDGVIMGDPMDEAVNFGPLVNEAQMGIVLDYIEKGKSEGAVLAYGGRRTDRNGFFVEPTVFTDVRDDMTIAQEEIFGPVLSVLDFATEEEALMRANATPFGLAAGVFTRDLTRAHRIAAGFEAGTCYINHYNAAPVEMPFGGSKLSGVGRENSKAAINHYSEAKTVYVGMGDVEAPF